MRDVNSRLKSTAVFLLKLNLLALPLYAAVYFDLSFQPLQDIWAAGLDQSLRSLGYETAIDGHMIGLKSGNSIHQIELSWDSTGWKSMYAIFALVMASPGTMRQKLRFLAFGVPLVGFINMLRITTTVAASVELGFEHFDFIHSFLWSGAMVALVLAVWYLLFFRQKNNN